MTVGVLALQGGVHEHLAACADLGRKAVPVRVPADLDGVTGVILPGGESTTMTLLLASAGLTEPLGQMLHEGLPAFGTCAGLILLAGPPDPHAAVSGFGRIDLDVARNGYGTQASSFEAEVDVAGLSDGPLAAVFIRAPVVTRVGECVEVLATVAGPHGEPPSPVVCRQGSVLVASFHPELTKDRRLHEAFFSIVDGD